MGWNRIIFELRLAYGNMQLVIFEIKIIAMLHAGHKQEERERVEHWRRIARPTKLPFLEMDMKYVWLWTSFPGLQGRPV